jgi:hypothetical protein
MIDTRESESAVFSPPRSSRGGPVWGSPWGSRRLRKRRAPHPLALPRKRRARGGEGNRRPSSDPRGAIGFSLGGTRKRRRSATSWLATSREFREDGRMARLLEQAVATGSALSD